MSDNKVRCVDCDNSYFAGRKAMSDYQSLCEVDKKIRNSVEIRECKNFKLALDLRKKR